MLTTTLEDLVDAIQRTADVAKFTDKHPVAYIQKLANRGLGALSTLCRTTNPEFQPIASTTVTLDGTNTVYGLPGNFRSLISCEYTHDGRKVYLQQYELHERAALTTPDVEQNAQRARFYKVLGTDIEFLPLAQANDTALLWFATDATQLAAGESVDVMDRLDSYVVWWAAREIAQERENWERFDRLTQQLGELEGDIRILARSRDLSSPARMVDERFAGRAGRPAWWRRW